ncbi:hypothetical protein BGZ60DRAFT_419129 [Tricladium varicosporioides]|nr:hypothetical protein BGZ60DRAFT_419129 [Hymenoscyphus varicosporioides]
MSKELPKTLLGEKRSSFALIDPSTELYHRKLDRHGWLNNSLRQHVAISYVWSEWKQNPDDRLPDWRLIRDRLLCILGSSASSDIRVRTGNASCCWLDSKCVDQDSPSSKSYWIPRMDEVYAEAKCTVLLLRDPLLSVLVPVVRNMTCNVKSKTSMLDWPHSCLLSQSCTALATLSPELEKECTHALRRLYDGTWRRRAWIFQEILLSKNYLLSFHDCGYVELGDIGVIAGLLFQQYPEEVWLGDLSDWCRRLFYLRHFYTETEFHHLSEANVLQMATGLEATVPADKIYALCGILKLKDVPYNMNHSADEAFQVVVDALVKKGRLSWLYAVPPPMNDGGLQLREANITPFVLTRMSDSFVGNRNKMHFSQTSVGFPVLRLGKITQTRLLADVLQEASSWIKEHQNVDFPAELKNLFFIPKIIRRVALDLVNPLLMDPLFDQICRGLDISREAESRPTRVWRMIMALFTRDTTSLSRKEISTNPDDIANVALADSAAQSLQNRLRMVQNSFLVLWWTSTNDKGSIETLSLGPITCKPGNQICAVKDDSQLLLAVSFPPKTSPESEEENLPTDAHFKGMIYSLDTVMTIQWRVKVLVANVVLTPSDMQGPLIGDHPYGDRKKDQRYDEYIKTDASRTTSVASLFGKEWGKKGGRVYLNLLRGV